MLGSNSDRFQLRHWQSDAVTTRQDLNKNRVSQVATVKMEDTGIRTDFEKKNLTLSARFVSQT
jgi:hypothetical protein